MYECRFVDVRMSLKGADLSAACRQALSESAMNPEQPALLLHQV
jgi:hypothetical protein